MGYKKHNRSEMAAVLGPYEALPYYEYIHTWDTKKQGPAA
jgi:hypothetical protein